jgi:hypothetical protein
MAAASQPPSNLLLLLSQVQLLEQQYLMRQVISWKAIVADVSKMLI